MSKAMAEIISTILGAFFLFYAGLMVGYISKDSRMQSLVKKVILASCWRSTEGNIESWMLFVALACVLLSLVALFFPF